MATTKKTTAKKTATTKKTTTKKTATKSPVEIKMVFISIPNSNNWSSY